MNDHPTPPAEILEHAQFVRRLAGALLHDDWDADDAAQETLATALERPPPRGSRVAAWLTTVLRNVVLKGRRSAARRGARERSAARPEATRTVASVVADEEILHAVADAVRSLDPGSREVVLLRHYEGLPPRAIALRLDLPVETVKSRLKRAHERLRTLLDERRGGNVEGWRSAMACLVGFDSLRGGIAPVGRIAMGTATKVGIGVAALALVGGGAWVVTVATPNRPPPPAATAKSEPARADFPAAPGLAARPESPAPPSVPTPAPPSDPDLPAGWTRKTVGNLSVAVPSEWQEDTGPVEGSALWLALDRGGKPSGGFGVVPATFAQTLLARIPNPTRRSLTVLDRPAVWSEGNSDGTAACHVAFDTSDLATPGFSFVGTANEEQWPAHRALVERILRLLRTVVLPPSTASSPRQVGEEPSAAQVAEWATSAAGDRIEGRVVQGVQPVPRANVRLLRVQMTPVGRPAPPPDVVRAGSTRENGTFDLGAVEPGSYALKVEAEGLATLTVAPVDVRAGETVAVRRVIVYGDAEVSGRVWRRDGLPASDRPVRAIPASPHPWVNAGCLVRTAADGTFRISGLTSGRWQISVSLGTEGNEFGDPRNDVVELSPGEAKSIEMGGARPEPVLRGTIRHSSGSPISSPGALVTVLGKSPTVHLPVAFDEAGRFERRIPAGAYRLTVACIGLDCPALAEDITVGDAGLARDWVVPGVAVACRVVEAATGKPFSPRPRSERGWVRIRPVDREAKPTDVGLPVPDDGVVRFCGVLPGRYVLEASPPFREPGTGAVTIDVVEGRDVSGIALEVRRP